MSNKDSQNSREEKLPLIRAANSSNITAIPFNLLRGLPFIQYEENLIVENARKLSEREVDFALIPSVEYANNGSLVSLDYGVACHKRSDLVILYAKQDIKKIQTVYFNQKCGSTPLLLKLLLKSKWKISPRFIRATKVIDPLSLSSNEALLTIHEKPINIKNSKVPVTEDLIRLWYDWTGLPFVFLLWSTRVGTFNPEQYAKINEVFGVCNELREVQLDSLSAKHDLPFSYLSRYKPDRDFYYAIKEEEQEGLNTFFQLCTEAGLLPETTYRSAKISLLTRKEAILPSKNIDDIFNCVLDGKRISMSDAIKILEISSLEKQGLVANVIRTRIFSDVSVVAEKVITFSNNLYISHEVSNFLVQLSSSDILKIEITEGLNIDFEKFLQFISKIKSKSAFQIEALTISNIISIAKKTEQAFERVCSLLIAAGVTFIGTDDYFVVFPTCLSEGEDKSNLVKNTNQSEKWINLMQVAFRLGLKAQFQLKLSSCLKWELVINYLQKIRYLQDLTGSIRSIKIIDDSVSNGINSKDLFDTAMKAVSISRIFLDNIANVIFEKSEKSPNLSDYSLGFGCNEISYKILTEDASISTIAVNEYLDILENCGISLVKKYE